MFRAEQLGIGDTRTGVSAIAQFSLSHVCVGGGRSLLRPSQPLRGVVAHAGFKCWRPGFRCFPQQRASLALALWVVGTPPQVPGAHVSGSGCSCRATPLATPRPLATPLATPLWSPGSQAALSQHCDPGQ